VFQYVNTGKHKNRSALVAVQGYGLTLLLIITGVYV
jgi:hypothetical protein